MAERFEGTLEQHGSGTLLEVPFDVRTVFGKARAPVRGTVNGHPFRTTVAVYGGCYSLSYTHRREYVEWVSGAKREETRRTRLQRAVAMLRGGVRHP
jgi:hypothetical protein